MIKNPIRIGKNKEKLIPIVETILKDSFTNRIIDVFGTCLDITINAPTNRILMNQNNVMLKDVLEYIIGHSNLFVASALDKLIRETNMDKDFGFTQCRRLYNENKVDAYLKPVLLLGLIYHSFNNQIRFNMLGHYNASFSKSGGFTQAKRNQLASFMQAVSTKHLALASKPWKYYMTTYREGDVILVDMPEVTEEYYDDNSQIRSWTIEDETQVLQMCEFYKRSKTKFILIVSNKSNPMIRVIEKDLKVVTSNGYTIYTNVVSTVVEGKE
jgi:site-specific DNA-adenine methylase